MSNEEREKIYYAILAVEGTLTNVVNKLADLREIIGRYPEVRPTTGAGDLASSPENQGVLDNPPST